MRIVDVYGMRKPTNPRRVGLAFYKLVLGYVIGISIAIHTESLCEITTARCRRLEK